MIDAKYYNNGKIKIGSEYYLNPLRKKYIEEDHDMLEIQKYLTITPSRKYRLGTILRPMKLGILKGM